MWQVSVVLLIPNQHSFQFFAVQQTFQALQGVRSFLASQRKLNMRFPFRNTETNSLSQDRTCDHKPTVTTLSLSRSHHKVTAIAA